MAMPRDPFERLAEQCRLRLQAERLTTAPRDVLAPPSELEQHYLVTLCRDAANHQVRIIFAHPLSEEAPPSMRDVLWWLASDAWAIARAGGSLAAWSLIYDYPVQAEATRRLFDHHAAQASALSKLLGEVGYRRLLALYEADVRSPSTGAQAFMGQEGNDLPVC